MKRRLGDGETFHFSEHSGEFAIQYKSPDLSKLIQNNKRLQEEDHHMKDEFRLCARIPVMVAQEWKIKFGIDINKKEDMKAVKKLLNSPDYKYLKTTSRVI